MFIRKWIEIVVIILIVNLVGCATQPKKGDETKLKEFEKLPGVSREKIDYLEEEEPEETRLSVLKDKIKKHIPIAKTQTPGKKTVVKEKPRPCHIAPARDIQTALRNAGYYTGKIDGKIGPKTDSAIKAFQKDNGLKIDGVVGKKTWNLLNKYLSVQEGVSISGEIESPIIQPLVSTEPTDFPTIEQVPEITTSSLEKAPAAEEIPSAVEPPVTKRNFTLLKIIIIIVGVGILIIYIYRQGHR